VLRNLHKELHHPKEHQDLQVAFLHPGVSQLPDVPRWTHLPYLADTPASDDGRSSESEVEDDQLAQEHYCAQPPRKKRKTVLENGPISAPVCAHPSEGAEESKNVYPELSVSGILHSAVQSPDRSGVHVDFQSAIGSDVTKSPHALVRKPSGIALRSSEVSDRRSAYSESFIDKFHGVFSSVESTESRVLAQGPTEAHIEKEQSSSPWALSKSQGYSASLTGASASRSRDQSASTRFHPTLHAEGEVTRLEGAGQSGTDVDSHMACCDEKVDIARLCTRGAYAPHNDNVHLNGWHLRNLYGMRGAIGTREQIEMRHSAATKSAAPSIRLNNLLSEIFGKGAVGRGFSKPKAVSHSSPKQLAF